MVSMHSIVNKKPKDKNANTKTSNRKSDGEDSIQL